MLPFTLIIGLLTTTCPLVSGTPGSSGHFRAIYGKKYDKVLETHDVSDPIRCANLCIKVRMI